MLNISVVMPVYNGEKFVKETIESVLNQTYRDFEFIIIDDGSTDNTVNIIKSFNDSRIHLLTANHAGIVKALNVGIKRSKGEYVVRIDADDICMPHRFETLLKFMQAHKDVAVCASWAEKINEHGEVTGVLEYSPVEHKDIRKYMILHNPFIHPTVMFRKEAIYRVGMYRKFDHNEDYELWTRVLRKWKGHTIPEHLIRYRVHSNQVTRKSNLHMRMVGVMVRALGLIRR